MNEDIQAIIEDLADSDDDLLAQAGELGEAIIEAIDDSNDDFPSIIEDLADSDDDLLAQAGELGEAIIEAIDDSNGDFPSIIEDLADSDDDLLAQAGELGEAIIEAIDDSNGDFPSIIEDLADSDDDLLAQAGELGEAIIEAIDDSNDSVFPETIDLTDSGDRQVKFTVNREAVFDNTIGFYEVSSEDGSVVDPLSGQIITPGEEGYQETALANRLDFSLDTANGETTEFTTELAGGSRYASFIVVDSEIESLLDEDSSNDPKIYFGSAAANADGFDHVSRLSENSFGYEDLISADNVDFNDLVIEYDFV